MTLTHQFYGAVLLQDDVSMVTATMTTGEEDHTPSLLVSIHIELWCILTCTHIFTLTNRSLSISSWTIATRFQR